MEDMIAKKLLRLFLLFLCSIGFISCNNKDETFHPISLNSNGIDLLENPSDPFTLTGRISSDGTEFSLHCTDQYSDMAYVSGVVVDDILYNPVKNILLNNKEGYQEEWGEIINSSATCPFTMVFKINPNKSEEERIFKITIGHGYWYRNIVIIQLTTSSAGSL